LQRTLVQYVSRTDTVILTSDTL